MKKVLIITNHSYMLYQFRRELIEKLMETYEVVLSMPFVGHHEKFQEMGCKCIETDVDRRGINPITDLKLIKTYFRILNEEKPDRVITYSIKPNVYGGAACAIKKIPYYANVQGLGTAFQKKGLAEFVTFLYKMAFLKVNTVFFENEENAAEFQKRKIIPLSKQTLLKGAGVNLEHYSYIPYKEENQIHFLYLGRIMKEKGVDELFEVMRRLKKEYKDKVVLDIVGFFEDEYKETVEALQKDNIAVFHGFQKETRPYYAAAHCVVLPSYHEGMSNVLLEAAACGRTVITSNIPGCREAVDDEKTGYLCEVKNEEALYKRMKKFIELTASERAEMGVKARAKIQREFDKEEVVRKTVESVKKSL